MMRRTSSAVRSIPTFDTSQPSEQAIAFARPGATTIADSQHSIVNISGLVAKDALDLRDIAFACGAGPTVGYSGTWVGHSEGERRGAYGEDLAAQQLSRLPLRCLL